MKLISLPTLCLVVAIGLSGCQNSVDVERTAAELEKQSAELDNKLETIKHRSAYCRAIASDLSNGTMNLEQAAEAIIMQYRVHPEVTPTLQIQEQTDDEFEAAARQVIRRVEISRIDPKVKEKIVPELRNELVRILNERCNDHEQSQSFNQ